MKEQVIERLIRYAKIDTQSDFTSETTPSTQKQFDLLHVLKDELAAIGLTDITLDDNGYLFATLEANTDKKSAYYWLFSTCGHYNRFYWHKR